MSTAILQVAGDCMEVCGSLCWEKLSTPDMAQSPRQTTLYSCVPLRVEAVDILLSWAEKGIVQKHAQMMIALRTTPLAEEVPHF